MNTIRDERKYMMKKKTRENTETYLVKHGFRRELQIVRGKINKNCGDPTDEEEGGPLLEVHV